LNQFKQHFARIHHKQTGVYKNILHAHIKVWS